MPRFSFLAASLQHVHPEWLSVLQQPELQTVLQQIDTQLSAQQAAGKTIYPPAGAIFRALYDCAPQETRVVILGQDPYHGAGEAMGLSFSVPDGVRIPPSLRNIYKALHKDIGMPAPQSGNLSSWAKQGVLLLNSVLTVEADQAGSHGKLGWQTITQALLAAVNQASPACVFLLWGNWARSHASTLDAHRHLILQTVHPSPLSASRGFFDCGHFSAANQWLAQRQLTPIDWQLSAGQSQLTW